MERLQKQIQQEIRAFNDPPAKGALQNERSILRVLMEGNVEGWVAKVNKEIDKKGSVSPTSPKVHEDEVPTPFLHPLLFLNTRTKPIHHNAHNSSSRPEVANRKRPAEPLLIPTCDPTPYSYNHSAAPRPTQNIAPSIPIQPRQTHPVQNDVSRQMDEASSGVYENSNPTNAFSSARDELAQRAKEGNHEAIAAANRLNAKPKTSSNHLQPAVKKALEGPNGNEDIGDDDEDLDPKLLPYKSLIDGEITKEILSMVVNMKLSASEASVHREDIAGLVDLKKVIDRKVLFPMKRPDLAKGLQRAPRGVLLFGPPGTGKTTIARWIATEGCASFYDVSPSSLMSKYVGETETIIKALFKLASFDSPSVLFLDEIDAVLGKRKDSNDESTVRMKNQILQSMEGFSTAENQMRVIIGATNRPESLDDAALRRFQKRVLVPLPDRQSRESMLIRLLDSFDNGCQLSPGEISDIANHTEGWNCSDIRNLAEKATDFRFDELEITFGGMEHIPEGHVPRHLAIGDFEAALKSTKSTIDVGDLQKYIDWDMKHSAK